jgi:hypothetical protein
MKYGPVEAPQGEKLPTSPLPATLAVIPSTTDVADVFTTCKPGPFVTAIVVLPLDSVVEHPALTELIVIVVDPMLAKGDVVNVPLPPFIVSVAVFGPAILAPLSE